MNKMFIVYRSNIRLIKWVETFLYSAREQFIYNFTTKTGSVFESVCPHMCLCTSAGFIIWVVGHHISSMQVGWKDEGDIHDPVDHCLGLWSQLQRKKKTPKLLIFKIHNAPVNKSKRHFCIGNITSFTRHTYQAPSKAFRISLVMFYIFLIVLSPFKLIYRHPAVKEQHYHQSFWVVFRVYLANSPTDSWGKHLSL